MKLKDKFDNPIMRHDLGRNEIEETKEQCVEIANEFAIGFAEWLNKNYIVTSDFLWLECDTMIKKNSKKLLEIYKKEKGL